MYSLDVNFLKDRGLDVAADAPTQELKKPTPIVEKIPIVVGGILLVIFPFLSYSYAQSFEKKQAEAEAKIQEIDAEIAKRQGESKSLEEIQAQVAKAKTETEALVQVFDKIRPWSAILQEIGDRTPPGVQVDSLSQSGSGDDLKLQINGSARSFNDVNDFVLFLQRSPFFAEKDIVLGNVTTSGLKIDITNQSDLPSNISLNVPEGVKYNITAKLNNVPTSGLIQELKSKGSIGLVTRLETLEEKGAIIK